jgi:hypothetical protein
MKIFISVAFVTFFLTAHGQNKLYIQDLKKPDKVWALRLKKYYRVWYKDTEYSRIWLASSTDSSLIFLTKRRRGEVLELEIKSIRLMSKTPFLGSKVGYVGSLMLICSPIGLVATPIIAIFDTWVRAREGLIFSGVLIGLGSIFTFPSYFYKSYDSYKNKIIIEK